MTTRDPEGRQARAEDELSQARATLREVQERWRRLFDLCPDGIIEVEADGRIVRANARHAEMAGFASPDELVGLDALAFTAPSCREQARAILRRRLAGEPIAPVEYELLRRDGTTYFAEISAALHRGPDEIVTGYTAFLHETTDRKRHLDELRETSRRLALALGSGGLGVWDWDIQNNDMFWDDRMLELYGVSRQDFVGGVEAWKQALHPEDQQRALAESQAALAGRAEYDTEFRILRPDGSVRFIKANGLVMRDASGTAVRMLGLNRDITERRQAEMALRQSEKRFEKLFESAPLLMTVGDAEEGTCLAANQRFLEVSGFSREEVIGKTSVELGWISHEDRRRIAETMRTSGCIRGMQLCAHRKDGSEVWCSFFGELVELDGKPRLLALAEDITERKRAAEALQAREEELRQAQKMESIGRLAGGVAHDFNNMLSVILGRIDMVLVQLQPGSPLRAELEEARRAAEHSADLTRQLLAFARRQPAAPQVLDLNEVAAGMLTMLRRLLGEDIELVWEPAADTWPIKMDPAQLHQVLANLCVNARDAIGEFGRITIATENADVTTDLCVGEPNAAVGQYAVLRVSDTGCGMAPETIQRLFEPFFTTKEAGKGTGLGLSTVYGVAAQNGGFIRVESQVGEGSTFRIYLPRQELAAPSEHPGVPGSSRRGQETVLLVEDELTVLRLTEVMLQRLGYTAIAAQGPAEALRVAGSHEGSIELLVTDVIMPEMSGAELAKTLTARDPNLKVLYVSGYAGDSICRQGVLESANFLEKPFTIAELASAVRRALRSAEG
ncbi:MAG: PAS domain S-box protein [Polyangiaceae bacterium]|nr:PAS domain S-box protein [Polyangiaceae bacterium]